MTLAILLFLEGLAMMEYLRRIRQFTALNVVFIYIIVSQLIFFYADSLGFRNFSGTDSRRTYVFENDKGLMLYATIFFITYFATIGLKLASRHQFAKALQQALEKGAKGQAIFLALLYLLAILHFLFLDKDILWQNSTYLLLNSPSAVGENIVARLISSTFQLVALSSVFLFAANLFMNRAALALAAAPLALWSVSFQIASCSRVSAILAFICGFLALLSVRGAKRIAFAGIFFCLGIFLLVAVLNGRGNGNFGLSSIPSTLSGAIESNPDKFIYAVANIFQGIFTTVDGITINSEHGTEYKLLSLSPFPSFVDGFESIRRSQEIRIAKYVPMSAISEAILFGPSYLAVVIATWLLLIRSYLRVLQGPSANIGMVLTGLIVLAFVEANAYPMRNVFRLLIIATVIALTSLMMMRRQTVRPASNRTRAFGQRPTLYR